MNHETNHCYVAIARKRGFFWHKKICEISACDYREIVKFQYEMFALYGNVKIEIFQGSEERKR